MPSPPATSLIRVIAVMGATATGKSRVALALAEALGGEIVSMDSRQAYRGLDIGTGKVGARERAHIPHHLLDILDVNETGSAGRHAAAAEAAIRAIAARRHVPIAAGGTGLYFRALFGGLVRVTIPRDELARIRSGFAAIETGALHERLARLDPERAAALSARDRVRVTRALELIEYTGAPVTALYAAPRRAPGDIAYLKLVLSMPRDLLRARIETRTRELFDAGWVDEVKALLARGVDARSPGMQSLGYGQIAAALLGGDDPRDRLGDVTTLTQQYAKRQETFFRGERDAVWIDMARGDAEDRIMALARDFVGTAPLNNHLTHDG